MVYSAYLRDGSKSSYDCGESVSGRLDRMASLHGSIQRHICQ